METETTKTPYANQVFWIIRGHIYRVVLGGDICPWCKHPGRWTGRFYIENDDTTEHPVWGCSFCGQFVTENRVAYRRWFRDKDGSAHEIAPIIRFTD